MSHRIMANSGATTSIPRGRAHTGVDHPEATAEFPRSRAHSDLNAKSSHCEMDDAPLRTRDLALDEMPGDRQKPAEQL